MKLFADGLDVLEAFLEVGTRTANPDLDVMLDESWRKLSESTNDTFERRCNLITLLVRRIFSELRKPLGGVPHICEIGNTTANEQNLAFRAERGTKHEI